MGIDVITWGIESRAKHRMARCAFIRGRLIASRCNRSAMNKGRARSAWIWACHRKRIILFVFMALATLDWIVLDRWQIAGRVVDAKTGAGISNAWILVDVNGERP